jgi:hypothetical protein
VEVPLTPFGIARRRVGPIAGSNHPPMQDIHVRYKEYDAPPPRPAPLRWLGDEIEMAGAERSAEGASSPLRRRTIIAEAAARAMSGCQSDGTDAPITQERPIPSSRQNRSSGGADTSAGSDPIFHQPRRAKIGPRPQHEKDGEGQHDDPVQLPRWLSRAPPST